MYGISTGTTILRMLIKLALLVFTLLVMAACRPFSGVSPSSTSRNEVEIDITSGLPSPSWTLTQLQSEDLEEMLSDLPPTDTASFFDGMGYRGFVITMRAPDRLIRVQQGFVQVEANQTVQAFLDPDYQLERWLVKASQPHIEPQLYSLLADGLER